MISPATLSGRLRAPSVAIVSSDQRKPSHGVHVLEDRVGDRPEREQHDEREHDDREAAQEGPEVAAAGHQWW